MNSLIQRHNRCVETASRFANFIALSSRGIWVDCSQWLMYSAGFFSLVKLGLLSPLPLWSVLLGAGLPLYLFCVMLSDVCQRRKHLRFDGSVRFLLLLIGAAIAVV